MCNYNGHPVVFLGILFFFGSENILWNLLRPHDKLIFLGGAISITNYETLRGKNFLNANKLKQNIHNRRQNHLLEEFCFGC